MTTSVFSTMLQRAPVSIIATATPDSTITALSHCMRPHAITPRVVDAGLLDPVDFTPLRISRKGQERVIPARTPTARVGGQCLVISRFHHLPQSCIPALTQELHRRRLGWNIAKDRSINGTALASWHTMILVDEDCQAFLLRVVRDHPALAQLLTSRD